MADVHVMVDCETWGTLPGCALRSIGAVTFDPQGDKCFAEQVFSCNIDRASCEAAGLKIDPETERWWSDQSQEAQDALAIDPWDLRYAVFAFDAWWTQQKATHFWSNGACFDEPVMRLAFAAVERRVPWKYWNVRDTRTVWDLGGINPRSVPRDGVAHNALADARHQAKCVTLAHARLFRISNFDPVLSPPVMIAAAELPDLRPGIGDPLGR